MENNEVADILDDIGDMLEMIGESRFRVGAYHRAGQVIRSLPKDIKEVKSENDGLQSIKGVGKGIAERLEELLDTGKMTYYEELKKKLPGSLTEIMHIQGLGPRKAKLLYDELGIETVGQLETAVKEHQVKDLPGMGAKTEENIVRGLELYNQHTGRLLLNQAVPAAEKIIDYLKKDSAVKAADAAGSLRRWKETIGDIDILVSTTDFDRVGDRFCTYPEVSAVLAQGLTKCSVLLHSGLQIDLRLISPEQYGAALHYFTGSKAHNIKLRQIAKDRGLKLSEYGLVRIKDNKILAGADEKDVFSALNLEYIDPVLREDNGEIEAAREGKLPVIVRESDIRGDLHVHSTASDGQSSIEEMAEYARKLGYEYLCLSDHAFNLKVAHGLDLDRFEDQWRRIGELNERWSDFKLLSGVELNINNEGGVDFDDDFLARFDIVCASVHSGFNQDKKLITERTIGAMENKNIDVICHPTGRILGRRPPYSIDLPRVFEAAARTKTCLELNAFPDRLDLNDDQLREAKSMGVKFAVSTDAHHWGQMEYMRYGLHTAQRGWLEKADIINTYPLAKLLKVIGS